MKFRQLGKTGIGVSEISLGTWQVGGKWGDDFNHNNADSILNAAIDQGVNFIDTADVYGEGESEKAVGRLVKNRSEQIYIASKCGRKLNPHTNESYTPQALRAFVEASLANMGIERLDLIQMHCPPSEVYDRPEVFELFERLKEEGKIANMGVSVEKVDEALKAIEYPNVTTVQIIFNMFRHKPNEIFFEKAKKNNVGILARVPLASGLLTGKFTSQTEFTKGDHRNFNRNGAAFDKGETFSGVDYETGLEAVSRLQELFPEIPLAHLAQKWILMFDAVSCVIPGASNLDQVISNIQSSSLSELTEEDMAKVKQVYGDLIREQVNYLW